MMKLLVLTFVALTATLIRVEANPDPQVDYNSQVGCGPPRLLNKWPNISVSIGQPVKLACPLDTLNSCLVDYVEWYHSSWEPREGDHSGRTLMKDAAVKFDPLMVVFSDAAPEHQGWYTCVVGNTEGRTEKSVHLQVRPPGQERHRRPGQYRPSPPEALMRRPEDSPMDANNMDQTVDQRFPVYSRFRGNRGFQRSYSAPQPRVSMVPESRSQPSPTMPLRPTPSMARPGDRDEQHNSVGAVHQHLRFIYDKIEDFQGRLDSIESRIRRIEQN